MSNPTQNIKTTLFTALVALSFAGLFACSDNHEPENAKQVGEAVEHNVKKATNAVEETAEDMVDSLDDAATDAGNAVEDQCEKLKQQAGAEDTDC